MKSLRFIKGFNQEKPCVSTLFIAVVLIFTACQRPEGVLPSDNYCSSGPDVRSVNDNNVQGSVKDAIYGLPAGYIGKGHPLYNPDLPAVIIPYKFATLFPFNLSVSSDLIRNDFFSTGTGSVKDYFLENSWGQFNLTEGFIASGTTLLQDTAFYASGQVGRDWTRNPDLARDICQYSNVYWPGLDQNGDYVIDRSEAIICFMGAIGNAGACRPSTVSISTNWGNYTISNSFVYFDCKRNDDPHRGKDDIRYNFPTIFHELCHGMFGLPDRYSDFCGSGKTGKYDIMSDPCGYRHLSVYDKMKLGWIRPKILAAGTGGRCYSFPAIESLTPGALILLPPSVTLGSEYWILENRYKEASMWNFDGDMPESGLAIWYVNATTGQIALVNSRTSDQDPREILYSAYDIQTGALFTFDPSASISEKLLITENGRGQRIVSFPSPPGNTMYINL